MKTIAILGPTSILALAAACNSLVAAPASIADDPDAAGDASVLPVADASPDVTVPAPPDSGANADARDAPPADAEDRGLDAASEADASPPSLVEIVSPDAGVGGLITGLVQEKGVLYGSSNGASANSGPVWRASTAGADFRFLAPYDANANGRVAGFAVSDPNAFFAVNLGPETGVRFVPLDGGDAGTVVGFYQGVVLGADPPGGSRIYISDGRTNGFDVEPMGGNPNPEAPPTIKCNRYPELYPPPLQLIVDSSFRLYWAYNGTAAYVPAGETAPLVQSIRVATADQVTSWGNAGCKPGQWTDLVNGVDVTGIAVDGSFVYYADTSAAIWRVPAQGGTPANLTANVTMPGRSEAPGALYVDEARVYWAPATGNVWAVAKDGTSVGPLVSLVPPGTGRSMITALASDASFLYFADSGDGSIWRLRK